MPRPAPGSRPHRSARRLRRSPIQKPSCPWSPSSTLALAACSPPADDKVRTTPGGSDAATATSAADLGGMDELVKAAKKEGKLNVIALPPDWANYGDDHQGVQREVRHQGQLRPAGRRQPGRDQRRQLSSRARPAPDVFDLGQSVALANTAMFAAVQGGHLGRRSPTAQGRGRRLDQRLRRLHVDRLRREQGPGRRPALDDLLSPEFKGKVALNGDPTQAGAAFSGVVMASLANGGSADDIAPGVDFFGKLKKAGNFLPVDPTSATIESGQTPVVIDWDYLNVAPSEAKLAELEGRRADDAVVAGYYFQAINKDAPHPAAARLWEEFLYSDEGQNLWLEGGARPVRADAMVKAGTIDEAAYDALPPGHRHAGHPDRRADREGRRRTWPPTGPRPSAEHAPPTHRTPRRPQRGSARASRPSAGRCCRSCVLRLRLPGDPDHHRGGRCLPGRHRRFTAGQRPGAGQRHRAARAAAAASCCRRSAPLVGAVLGALLAYCVVTAPATGAAAPRGRHRRLRGAGPVRRGHAGLRLHRHARALAGSSPGCCATTSASTSTGPGWLYRLPGLVLVYTYFQIPLMVIVFLPALDGLRPQWREAAVSLGGATWQYWRQVAVPLLRAGVPRLGAAAVRQRVRGVRHRRGPGQPGQPDRAAADPRRAHQRGRPRPGRTSARRWPSGWSSSSRS